MLGRARVGRDSKRATGQYAPGGFNPRARVGRDGLPFRQRNHLMPFQSTRPRGARHARSASMTSPTAFQSTRPRGARLYGIHPNSVQRYVSIHAPAWGATEALREQLEMQRVSIHAPAWGATVHLLFPIILHKYASLFEDVSHVCPHFRFMSVME